MTRRYHSSVAVATTIPGGTTNVATSIVIAAATGLPASYPYTMVIDDDTTTMEAVEVTNRSGTTLTVTRGVDGTTAQSHSAGATIHHGWSARDLDEPNAWINAGHNHSTTALGGAVPQSSVTSLVSDLAAKAALASPTFTGTVVLPATTSVGNVTSTELGYLDGVTSALQTQLGAKAPTASPTFTGAVEVSDTANADWGAKIFVYQPVDNTNACITAKNASGADRRAIMFFNGTTEVGRITTSTTATTFVTTSDHRLKENLKPISGALARLGLLNALRFNFISEPDRTVDGFLAHEVADVVPEAVAGVKDATDDDGNPILQGIDQSKLVPLLVAAVQEQQAQIDALTARLDAAGL